jgi:hypothetical protein
MREFEDFTEDLYIPSIGENGVNYTWISKEGMNEAVRSGWMSSPPSRMPRNRP